MVDQELEARVAELEQAVAELQAAAAVSKQAAASQDAARTEGAARTQSAARTQDAARSSSAAAGPGAEDAFWALEGLERRAPDSVMVVGSVDVPDAGPVRWQVGQPGEALLQQDWTEVATTLDALAHPARLTILRLVMKGVRTTAELLQQDSLGTTGQLHHHLRQLVAAGWLTSPRRAHYEVPAPRVVPLLAAVMAATR